MPLFAALRQYPSGILKVLLLTTSACIGTIMFTFGLAFATRPEFGIELPRTTMIWAAICGNGIGVVLHPFFGLLSDRVGRRPLIIVGSLGAGVLSYLYFWAIISENIPMIFVGAIGAHAILYAAFNATFQTFAGEQFNVRVRFTATSVGFQAGVIVVGFTPLIATSLVTPQTWYLAPSIILTTCIAAALVAVFSKETNHIRLEDLGRKG
ncbi:MAG: major facilitator transporter [Mycobacterium sp.]|nr:major facilitator transporter [Mycobacterium sp.]